MKLDMAITTTKEILSKFVLKWVTQFYCPISVDKKLIQMDKNFQKHKLIWYIVPMICIVIKLSILNFGILVNSYHQ
ncbi:unnamed protein product [Paramecium octaurelia]|uniref:Uncharacterized protein n=1 Tax=Paramecium octaurelia TaxID=43137 RepID=A0A8S1VXZ1_PAROT|nr:unnamed protein product [Paramecium octaurelia]